MLRPLTFFKAFAADQGMVTTGSVTLSELILDTVLSSRSPGGAMVQAVSWGDARLVGRLVSQLRSACICSQLHAYVRASSDAL